VVQATGPCAYAAAFLNAFGPGPPLPLSYGVHTSRPRTRSANAPSCAAGEEAEQAEPAWEGGVDFHTRQAAAGGVDPFSREQAPRPPPGQYMWPLPRRPGLEPRRAQSDREVGRCGAQVQALADRLRERLITCGYEDPRSEGFRSWFALEPHAAVRLYPPSAFYTHHWREDSSAAEGRSRARFLQLPAPQAPPPSPRGGIRHDCAVARRPRRA